MADKLVKVWRTDGENVWVLVHLEVQTQRDIGFAERMYVYNYRLFDRHHHQVASLAVLGDEYADWRPDQFKYVLWGCQVGIQFPAVKLLDYQERWDELDRSQNPFAVIVMAHLKTLQTRASDEERKQWKYNLVRRLYERGYQREDVLHLFRFIDWLMKLPEELEEAFWQEVQRYEEANRMTYITSVERIGIQKGLEQGRQEGILQGIQQGQIGSVRDSVIEVLEIRFGDVLNDVLEVIGRIENIAILKHLHKKALTASSLQEFAQSLPKSS